MVAKRGADVRQGRVPQPLCHWYGADHDIGDRVRFVENRQNLLQGGSVHDLGVSERPNKQRVCSVFGDGRERPYSASNQLGVIMVAFGSKER